MSNGHCGPACGYCGSCGGVFEELLDSGERDTRETAVTAGMQMARRLFENRGNHSEIHLSEPQLAAALAIAFERGVMQTALVDKFKDVIRAALDDLTDGTTTQ